MYYINGDIYEGEWVDDCREGMGEIVYGGGIGVGGGIGGGVGGVDGRYVGMWRDNMCNG